MLRTYVVPSTLAIECSLPLCETQCLACLFCGDSMKFVRTIPRAGVLPELFVFHCSTCNDLATALQ
jgi:hypothetical protein